MSPDAATIFAPTTNRIQSALPPILFSILVSIGVSLNVENRLIYGIILCVVLTCGLFVQVSNVLLIAMSIWAFLPISYISPDAIQSIFNLPTLLVLIYLFRTKQHLQPRGLLIVGVALVYLALSSLDSVNPLRSFGWIFQILVLLICFVSSQSGGSKLGRDFLLRGISYVSILIGILAVVEFALGHNFTFSGAILPSYADSSKWQETASLRVSTTLGHPLNNGLFFSTASLIVGKELLIGKIRPRYVVSFVLSLLGLLSSGSRAAAVALIAGLILVAISRWSKIQTGKRLALSISSPLVVFIIFVSPWMQSFLFRVDSAEGQSSGTYRLELLQWGDYFWQYFSTSGTGPGTSGTTWRLLGNTAPLENGLLQLWVSLGLISGLIFITALFVIAMRNFTWDVSPLAIFFPILIYIPTTNFLEDSSSYLAFFSMAVLLSRSLKEDINPMDESRTAFEK
jgi:hypothetical protein